MSERMPQSRISQSWTPGSQPQHASEPPSGLSAVIRRRISRDPHAARLVQAVWSRLAEVELAGHDPGVLAALRYALMVHQPTRRGTCRACQWRTWPFGWRRRRWPCATWIQIRAELLGGGVVPPVCPQHRRIAGH
ncbi:MAG: hypothetical protein ACRDRP_17535 [Pseudonocardiaceae bacterium]